jgi:hypothetical protein
MHSLPTRDPCTALDPPPRPKRRWRHLRHELTCLHTAISCREFYPDPAAPSAMLDSSPGVDLAFQVYWVLNSTESQNVSSSAVFAAYYAWSSAIFALGGCPAGQPASQRVQCASGACRLFLGLLVC